MASRFKRVIGLELDASAIACAQNNARVYSVESAIQFVHADCFSWLSSALESGEIVPAETVIFASPPWGGPAYRNTEIFDLETMTPYGLHTIEEACKGMQLVLFLPRNGDLNQISRYRGVPDGTDSKIDVVQMCMDGASKAMVAYLPASHSA